MATATSVVVATRDGESFVGEQIRSILDQTVPPAEVIVGDDASSDSTIDIIERISSDHRRGGVIRLVRRTEALGVAKNFNDLIRRSRGDLIAFADQDDWWPAERLAILQARFVADPRLRALHHDARLIDASGRAFGSLFEALRITDVELSEEEAGRGFARLIKRNLATGATMMIRRDLVELAGSIPDGWLHDEWYAIVAAAVDGLSVDRRRLIDYRQHGANEIGARRLTVATAVAKLTQDGVDRNDRLLERAQSLRRRIAEMPGVAPARVALATDKVDHELYRVALPERRLKRVPAVVGAWRRGRYERLGNGMPDVVRDLIQPRRERDSDAAPRPGEPGR